ncbi:MAG: hypothetical protein ACU4EP_01435 [Candidatus Nitrosoglobus sp.]
MQTLLSRICGILSPEGGFRSYRRRSQAPCAVPRLEVRHFEVGRVVHGDLCAEAAVAQVRPIADLAVADTHKVGQAIVAEIGQVDERGAVSED